MNIDNEKLYDALDSMAYVLREGSGMMLPDNPEDEKPFLLAQLKRVLDNLIKEYVENSDNEERSTYYNLRDKE
tara:strand:+ start:615 stop:833 length:219 start_codon:yes stop_codon:yes gene_type:complete